MGKGLSDEKLVNGPQIVSVRSIPNQEKRCREKIEAIEIEKRVGINFGISDLEATLHAFARRDTT
jgi:hypothetical protein